MVSILINSSRKKACSMGSLFTKESPKISKHRRKEINTEEGRKERRRRRIK